MREVDLNKKVAQWISKYGWAHKRIANPGRAGEPDVTGCMFGIRIELEGKLPGEEPTKLQHEKLRRWKQAGAITGWYTSLEEAQKIVIEGFEEYSTVIGSEYHRLLVDKFLKGIKKQK